MRNISDYTLGIIQQRQGLEPVIIVSVNWNGTWFDYSDKIASGLRGKILEVANLESVVDITGKSSSVSLSVVLDDSDFQIKSIYNICDVHKRPVAVYQWFTGIPLNERFLLFEGLISSPIVWKEGDRTFSFEVVSKLEDNEVGFAPEDGTFTNVPVDLASQAWPMPFGKAVNVPGIKMDTVPNGALLHAIGIADNGITEQLNKIDCETGKQLAIAACLSSVGAKLQFEGDLGGAGKEVYDKGTQMQQRAQDMRRQVSNKLSKDAAQLLVHHKKQKSYDTSHFSVINGERFIQNRFITLIIGDATYRGQFHGGEFFVSQRKWLQQSYPGSPPGGPGVTETDSNPITIEDPQNSFLDRALFGGDDADDFITPTALDQQEDPCGPHNLIIPACGSGDVLGSTAATTGKEGFFYSEAGTAVNVGNDYPIRHVVSIIPGTIVHGVAAYRGFKGIKQLMAVPKKYYDVIVKQFGYIHATIVQMKFPLSTIDYQDWEDDIYVTVTSPVGPNIADIIAYLVTQYSNGLSVDAVSFAATREYLEPYHANFVITEKQKLVDLIKNLAFQGMCALWISGDVVYIKFLPIGGSPVGALNEGNVELKSLEIETTDTEQLVTKFVATWKQNYAAKATNKLIIKSNLSKYGIHEESFDFFAFNNHELVKTVATFWMIRKSNSWKRVKVKAFLDSLRLETWDYVELAFDHPYVANEAVTGIIESCQFDSSGLSIALEIWTPVRTGEMEAYEGSYPLHYQFIYPHPAKDLAGNVGAIGPNANGNFANPATGPEVNIITTGRAVGATSPANNNPDTNGSISSITTVAKIAPAGIGNGQIDQMTTGTVPRTDYKTRDYKEIERPKIQFSANSVPGIIVAKIGFDTDSNGTEVETRQVYQVNAYLDGLDNPPSLIKAVQLQIDKDDELPSGAWFLIGKQVSIKVNGKGQAPDVKFRYIMQAPVWM